MQITTPGSSWNTALEEIDGEIKTKRETYEFEHKYFDSKTQVESHSQ